MCWGANKIAGHCGENWGSKKNTKILAKNSTQICTAPALKSCFFQDAVNDLRLENKIWPVQWSRSNRDRVARSFPLLVDRINSNGWQSSAWNAVCPIDLIGKMRNLKQPNNHCKSSVIPTERSIFVRMSDFRYIKYFTASPLAPGCSSKKYNCTELGYSQRIITDQCNLRHQKILSW